MQGVARASEPSGLEAGPRNLPPRGAWGPNRVSEDLAKPHALLTACAPCSAPAHTHKPRRSLGPVPGGLCGHPISIGKDERLQDTRGLLEGPHCPLVFTEQGGVGRMEINYRPWPCWPRNAHHGQDGTSTWPGASSQDPQAA